MELVKQRDEYERRVSVLRRELEMLRKQKQELVSEGVLERDHILRENGKLQVNKEAVRCALYFAFSYPRYLLLFLTFNMQQSKTSARFYCSITRNQSDG